jgi:hypothetical protein
LIHVPYWYDEEGEVGGWRKAGRAERAERAGRKEQGGAEGQREDVLIIARWDKTIGSLSSTLHVILPEVFPKTEIPPIPNHPPTSQKMKY